MLLKKVTTFLGAAPHPKDTSGDCQINGVGLKGAVVPLIAKVTLIAKKILDLIEAKNEPRSIIR
jgi:hypothetical protein